ncbi:MAG: MFS transporter [bacterium]
MRRLSPYSVQFLANAGSTVAVVYVPLMARDLGAGTSTIGLLVATYQVAALSSNLLFGRWADYGNRKTFVVVGTVMTAAALVAHAWAGGLAGLFAVRALTGLTMGVFPSALVAYYYDGRPRLGRFTSLGALGWGAGAFAAGAVALGWLFPVAGAALALGAVVAIAGLSNQRVRLAQPFFDGRVFRRNWRLYLSFYLRHSGAASIWAIFPVYMSDLGASRFGVGLLYGLNPVAQFLFMNALERGAERSMIRAGLALSVIVFVAYAFVPSYRWLIPVQVALALSWSLLYLGSLRQLLRRNPERSTAAGLLQSVLGFSAVTGALLTGVTGAHGYPVVMLVAATLALAGMLVFFLVPDREA